jgi:hypothetical protein
MITLGICKKSEKIMRIALSEDTELQSLAADAFFNMSIYCNNICVTYNNQ